MTRLANMKPRFSGLPPRLGYMPGDEKGRDKQRGGLKPWRAWYGTERWRKLRLAVFVRDGFKCQRSGELCAGKHPAPNSPVANHKRPHRGDPELFWDIGNIETVAKHVHDNLVQVEEQAVPQGQWD